MRRVLVTAVALLLIVPAAAPAHGGAAQVALLEGDTSYPDGVPIELRRGLDGMVRAARERGYGLKVALVGDVFDVERNRTWLYDPQSYANYLAGLMAPHERILTVHPSGFGGNALGERPALALGDLPDGEIKAVDALVVRAMEGVHALTRANGTPVPLPAVARETADDDTAPLWLFVGGPLLLLALGAGALAALRR